MLMVNAKAMNVFTSRLFSQKKCLVVCLALLLQILVTIVFTVIPVSLSGALAIILTVCYQYLLNMHGLKEYILHGSDGKGSRSGILEANREGIYSCVGYSAIYLAGVSIGSFVFQKR